MDHELAELAVLRLPRGGINLVEPLDDAPDRAGIRGVICYSVVGSWVLGVGCW